MASEAAAESSKPAAAPSRKKRSRKAVRKAARKAHPKAGTAVKRRPRKLTAPEERARILDVADRERLTALEVQKRFGVKPVTYYSWRKANKKRPGQRRGAAGSALALGDFTGQIREAVRSQIAEMLPGIVAQEVELAIHGAGARRKRK